MQVNHKSLILGALGMLGAATLKKSLFYGGLISKGW